MQHLHTVYIASAVRNSVLLPCPNRFALFVERKSARLKEAFVLFSEVFV